jgi:hypothetical protein
MLPYEVNRREPDSSGRIAPNRLSQYLRRRYAAQFAPHSGRLLGVRHNPKIPQRNDRLQSRDSFA